MQIQNFWEKFLSSIGRKCLESLTGGKENFIRLKIKRFVLEDFYNVATIGEYY